MQDNRLRERSACSIRNSPAPETIPCTNCGADVEMWTDEEEATCGVCGRLILKK